jgi:hypothetical protein
MAEEEKSVAQTEVEQTLEEWFTRHLGAVWIFNL